MVICFHVIRKDKDMESDAFTLYKLIILFLLDKVYILPLYKVR